MNQKPIPRTHSGRHLLLAGCAVLAIFYHSDSSAARKPPTRAETYEWLQNQLSRIVQYDYEGTHYTRMLDVEDIGDCKLTLTDKIRGGSIDRSFEYEFRFADLDMAHHEILSFAPGAWSLRVPTRAARYVIRIKSDPPTQCGSAPCRNETTNEIMFFFDDRALATRASRALQRAIKLCGGKADAF